MSASRPGAGAGSRAAGGDVGAAGGEGDDVGAGTDAGDGTGATRAVSRGASGAGAGAGAVAIGAGPSCCAQPRTRVTRTAHDAPTSASSVRGGIACVSLLHPQ